MYKKINVDIGILDAERLKGSFQWRAHTFAQYLIKDTDYLIVNLLNKLNFKIQPDIINFTEIDYPGTIPHNDDWPLAFNYYINAGNDKTSMFQLVDESGNSADTQQKKLTFYTSETLQEVDSFVANAGDCYIFSTHRIHTVTMNTPNTTRQMIRMGWRYITFNDIDIIFNNAWIAQG